MDDTQDQNNSFFYSEVSKATLDICKQYAKDKKDSAKIKPYYKNGQLSFDNMQDSLVFLLDCLQNEFDTITRASMKIEDGAHNDRLAKVMSAMQQYKKALNTDDKSIKQSTLVFADNDLTYALNALRKEIQQNIDEIRNIPTDFIGKLFPKVSMPQIDEWLRMIYDSAGFFIAGVYCLIEVNKELNEERRLEGCVLEYSQFLRDDFSEVNTKLLIGYDVDENENKWRELQRNTQSIYRLADYFKPKNLIAEE